MKETIFFSCLGILIVFEMGYYIIYPTTAWAFGLGALTSIIITGVATALVAGLNVGASGENMFGTKLVFFVSTLMCILFKFDIPVSAESGSNWVMASGVLSFLASVTKTPTIPVGIGLLHPNLTSVFIIDNDPSYIGMFAMMIVTVIVFLTIISGILIVMGGSDSA